MLGAESNQGVEGGHRSAASVEVEGELVEVELQVRGPAL